MKFGILGSCISRDIFRELNLDHLVDEYRARTSIHSLMAGKKANYEDINFPNSKFQTKMVKSDFDKTPLNLDKCDYLIIDLIDERFEVIKNFNSIVTLSSELLDHNEIATLRKYLIRGSKKDYRLWKKAVKKLNKVIKIPIILHKSRLSNKINFFSKDINIDFNYIDKMNNILENYEKILCKELDIIGTIDVSEELLVSDIDHVWGYSPYHYIPEYYQEAMRQLFIITNTNSRVQLVETDFTINLDYFEGKLVAQVEGNTKDLLVAFYVLSGKEVVYRGWYSKETSFAFEIGTIKDKNINVNVFLRNSYNEIMIINSGIID